MKVEVKKPLPVINLTWTEREGNRVTDTSRQLNERLDRRFLSELVETLKRTGLGRSQTAIQTYCRKSTEYLEKTSKG